MALRIRTDGTVVCAAQYPEKPGDFYISDEKHYALACHFRAEETERDREWAAAYGDDEKMEAWRAKYPEHGLGEIANAG